MAQRTRMRVDTSVAAPRRAPATQALQPEVSPEASHLQSAVGDAGQSFTQVARDAGHSISRLAVARPQAQLTVSQPGDPLEEEAERTADEVMRMDASPAEQPDSSEQEEDENSQAGPATTTTVSKQAARQVSRNQSGNGDLPEGAESQVESVVGSGGAPLEGATRGKMEARFGHDFSRVRVHTDEPSSRSAQAIQAHAYTLGSDIAFDSGKYAPGTRDGDRLLAHELTHVVQQTGGGAASGADGVSTSPASIARQPGAARQVQRDNGHGTAAPAAKPSFEPKVTAEPTAEYAFLGDTILEKLTVANPHEAPAGSTLDWVLDPQAGAPVVQNMGIKPQSGAHVNLTLKAVSPGDTTVSPTLVVDQTKAGELDYAPPVDILIEVMPPLIETASVHQKDASKDPERLSVGDTLIIDYPIENITHASELESQISTMGLGKTLQFVASSWPAPNTYRLELQAADLGAATIATKFQFGQGKGIKAIPAPDVESHVEMDKSEFMNKCSEANTHIDNAYTAGDEWMLDISRAYGMAWKNHTAALKGQSAMNKLVGDLILSAALAFVPGGIGGIIGKAMKDKGAGDFLADGVKDLAKWGMRTAVTQGVQASSGGGDPLTKFPEDPLMWENTSISSMRAERLKVGSQLENWQHKVNTKDPDFFMDFEPVQAIRNSLTVAGQPLEQLDAVDVEAVAIAFEKGFWKTWLEKYAYTSIKVHDDADGATYYSEKNTGKEIKKRCEAIGLEEYDQYVKEAEDRADAETEKRNNERKPSYLD